MLRVLCLLLLLLPVSCQKKDAGAAPVTASQTDKGEEPDARSSEEAVPSTRVLGEKREAERPAPKVTLVRSDMDILLLNSPFIPHVPFDFDMGKLPAGTRDERYDKLARFLDALIDNRNPLKTLVHPEYADAVMEMVATIQTGFEFTSYRYGEIVVTGYGAYIPFRFLGEDETAIGYAVLSSQGDVWYIQDIIYNPENIESVKRDSFTPSVYRWMEVF